MLYFFLIFAKNIDCWYTAYNQNVLNKNKSNEVYPGNPQFNYIKVVLRGVESELHGCVRMVF